MSIFTLLPRVGIAVLIAGCFLAVRPGNAAPPITSPYRPSPHVHIALPPQAAAQSQRATAVTAASSSTNNLSYNGGPVEESVAAYTIFWSPHGTISSEYRTLINRYFQDVGGSGFYNIVSQYYQLPGPTYMQNISTLGDTWIDTNPYPGGRGTSFNPLSDTDIENEVTRALSVNSSWGPAGLGKIYFVYTEPGIESCFDPAAGPSDLACTLGVPSSNSAYCAYHSAFGTISHPVIYANMPYGETWPGGCRSFSTSPNGNLAADAEISSSSHEHFEAANDPLLDAWYDSDFFEIADKCSYRYGPILPDGRNLTLNGNPYIIQLEWSNANSDGVTPFSGCVAALTCYSLTLSASPAAGGNPAGNPTSSPGCPPGQYTKSTTVTIQPGTNFGYTFTGWTDDADCTDGSVTMTASKSCTANFAPTTDLSVANSASPNPAQVQNPLTYTVVVGNGGISGATGVTLSDTLYGNVTFGSATPSQGTCSQAAGTVTCALGSIANSGSVTVSIVVTPTAGKTLTNTATVSGNEPDPISQNNSVTITTPALWQCTKSDSSVVYRAWQSPTGDDDCDGFTTALENFMGTLPLVACAATSTLNDELPPDGWPVDFNNDQASNLTDIFLIVPHINTADDAPGSSPRFDLSADGFINLSDIFKAIPFLNKSCEP